MKEHCVVSRVQFPSVLLYIIFSKQSDVQVYKSLYSLGTMLELEIVQGAIPWCTNTTVSSVQDTPSKFFYCGTVFSISAEYENGTRIGSSSNQQSTKIQTNSETLARIDVPSHHPYICKARYKHEWV